MTTPPPSPPSAQRWEHTYAVGGQYGHADAANELLARYSADGWELVSHTTPFAGGTTFTFKRPWVPR
ncbi:hypothetical protein OHR68_13820 [Spirillospora sp. NBC_00431]